MVDAITPITSTAASEPTRIGTSTSIETEPDNAWIAARQSRSQPISGHRSGLRGRKPQAISSRTPI